ncbi:holo-ACP synthase [Halorhodospira halochloris]|uniref:holo-ACP synthase n=1 Tax=Halorhodospira halochloris TaxID=1052 RepID=UPI001EE7E4D8|nr:holo-ACP synthase [Halorhodospira halochloris]MCG5530894.1 holo-ACP synthase [Halorhodospira halochloris]
MIAGIGTDIVAIERMRKAWQRHGERLAQRILTPHEFDLFDSCVANEVAFLARRFAAKEAAAKALGTGFRDGVGLRSLEVGHDRLGKPGLRLLDGAAKRGEALKVSEIHLSLSDERDYAVAFVIMVAGQN